MVSFRSISTVLLLAMFGCQTASITPLSQEESDAGSQSKAVTNPTVSPAAKLRLTQMVVTGDNGGLGPFWVTTRFTYKKDKLLQRAVYSPDLPNSDLIHTYSYDQQDRVSSFLMAYQLPRDNGDAGVLYTFTYKENSYENRFIRVKADGQPFESNNMIDIYLTNQAGQVTEWVQEGIIRYGQLTRGRWVYTYEKGNIVKASYINGNNKEELSISYQYDDKVNPFYNWMYAIDPVLRCSRNNIVQTQVSQAPVQKNEYTYNDQGFPITKKESSKGAVMTYTYETY